MADRAVTKFVLDDQLCFALYSASQAMTNAYRTGLARLGLTYTQYVVLLLLWEHGSMPMGDLGERLHLNSATLSPLLSRLEDSGLVTRARRPEDERTVQVTCTTAGHALRNRVHAVQNRVEIETGLTPAEIATMRTDLRDLAGRLRAHTAEAASG